MVRQDLESGEERRRVVGATQLLRQPQGTHPLGGEPPAPAQHPLSVLLAAQRAIDGEIRSQEQRLHPPANVGDVAVEMVRQGIDLEARRQAGPCHRPAPAGEDPRQQGPAGEPEGLFDLCKGPLLAGRDVAARERGELAAQRGQREPLGARQGLGLATELGQQPGEVRRVRWTLRVEPALDEGKTALAGESRPTPRA